MMSDREQTAMANVAMLVTTDEGTILAPEVKYGKQAAKAHKHAGKEDPEHLKIPKATKQKKQLQEARNSLREPRSLTSVQLEAIKATFKLFDKDGDGFASVNDMGALLRSLGQNPTNADIKDFIHEIDGDMDGMFDLKDFTRLMSTRMKSSSEMENELYESFKLFDLNRDGYVSFEELRAAMLTIGEPMTDAEVRELFQLCDLNKDGKIDYDEFVKAMTSDAMFK